jgi:hypothetical protein
VKRRRKKGSCLTERCACQGTPSDSLGWTSVWMSEAKFEKHATLTSVGTSMPFCAGGWLTSAIRAQTLELYSLDFNLNPPSALGLHLWALVLSSLKWELIEVTTSYGWCEC